MSGGGPLRGLSRGMQVFLLVDVLLVLLLVVLLATRSGGGGADPAPSTAATATGDVEASRDAEDAPASGEVVAFTLPSGNIACEMSAEGVVCTIGDFTYAAPQVTGCDAPTGHVVRLDAEGFRFACEDDGVPPRPQDPGELAYGARETVGDYTCASGTDGVTCLDAAGTGFRLARAQWTALP